MAWLGQGKKKETLDYQASLLEPSWAKERNYADEIMKYIQRHKLQFQLDELTRGKGNCFMIAVLQQLNKKEVFNHMSSEIRVMARNYDHTGFRRAVTNFIKHQRMLESL